MKKYLIQNFVDVEPVRLVETVEDLKASGHRLGQICASIVGDKIEVLYTFDKDYVFTNLRVQLAQGEEVQSITGVYWPAFVYENEVHDLFGVTFKHLALDFAGGFYKLALPTPWNPAAAEREAAMNEDGK